MPGQSEGVVAEARNGQGARGRPGPAPVELTILMPCLNEAETLAICIEKARNYLDRAGVAGEVLIADNGSTDGSQEIARAHGARVVDVPAKGYGAALLGGISAAQGKYLIMGDADDSYDFSQLDAFVERLRAGGQLVMGNRFQGGIAPGAMPVLHRYLGNPVLSLLGRMFFKIPVGDFHCGLRGFDLVAIRGLGLQTTGMEFASEMVVRAAIGGLRIEEVPTSLKPDGRSRPPHLKTWRDGWRHLKFLLMYSPRWLFFYPGGLLTGVGVLLAGVLFLGPFRVSERVVVDLNAFVAACFMIIAGVQLITFGILSRTYAAMTGFLPASPGSDALQKHVDTDRMALTSAGLALVGLIWFGAAFWAWAQLGFGVVTSPVVPRLVIAGLALVAVGLQTFFAAFLLGTLAIPKLPGPRG